MESLRILDPQYGKRFVGRGEDLRELNRRILKYRILVVTGDRGIGKSNLIYVAKRELEQQERSCYLVSGSPSLFYEDMGRVFGSHILSKIRGITSPYGGVTLHDSGNEYIMRYMEKSKEKVIFIENAQEMDDKATEVILEASSRNPLLRFVLEVATPYVHDIALAPGSYEALRLKPLGDECIESIVKSYPLTSCVAHKIVVLSKGYPYLARSLVYVCSHKSNEGEMTSFLQSLRDDDMKYNIDQLHSEVLKTLSVNSQEVVSRLSIAPRVLTLRVIEGFCNAGARKTFTSGELDASLSELRERGVLLERKGEEGQSYEIYHPLFREYLRYLHPLGLRDREQTYYDVMKELRKDNDSLYLLSEVFDEQPFFERLLELVENEKAIYSTIDQAFVWGKLEQALYASQCLLNKSEQTDNKEWKMVAYSSMGNVCQIRGELGKALEYHDRALKFSSELGSKEEIVGNLINIGLDHQIRGELDKALEYYERVHKSSNELGAKHLTAAALGNMGNIFRIKGELEKALDFHTKALKLHEELREKDRIGIDLGNVGNVYLLKGEPEKALDFHTKALKLNREVRNIEGIMLNLSSIGLIHQDAGKLDKALEYNEKALALSREYGFREVIAGSLTNIGSTYYAKRELDKALEYYNEALEIEEKMGSKEGIMITSEFLGDVYRDKGENERALVLFEKALRLGKGLGMKRRIASILLDIGAIHQDRSEFEKALDFYENAAKLAQELGMAIIEGASLANIGMLWHHRGEPQKATEYYEKAMRILHDEGEKGEEIRVLVYMGDCLLLNNERKKALECYLKARGLISDTSIVNLIDERIKKISRTGN